MNDNDFEQFEFDSNDEVSYYFGNLTRDEVKEILLDASIGTFLIRDSNKDSEQKVLCVKEGTNNINNYKIIHTVRNEETSAGSSSLISPTSFRNSLTHVFHIHGKENCLFASIAKILEFYSTHYLNQSPLVKPAFHHKKVIALHDFLESDDPNEDLYFKKDEILSIVEYTQGEHWWKAKNSRNQTGLIPATLVRRLKPNEVPANLLNEKATSRNDENKSRNSVNEDEDDAEDDEDSLVCPFNARVIEDYTPSPYEHSHIALRKGQIVTVLETKSIGKWLGQINSDGGKKGFFPFNRVEIIEK